MDHRYKGGQLVGTYGKQDGDLSIAPKKVLAYATNGLLAFLPCGCCIGGTLFVADLTSEAFDLDGQSDRQALVRYEIPESFLMRR